MKIIMNLFFQYRRINNMRLLSFLSVVKELHLSVIALVHKCRVFSFLTEKLATNTGSFCSFLSSMSVGLCEVFSECIFHIVLFPIPA